MYLLNMCQTGRRVNELFCRKNKQVFSSLFFFLFFLWYDGRAKKERKKKMNKHFFFFIYFFRPRSWVCSIFERLPVYSFFVQLLFYSIPPSLSFCPCDIYMTFSFFFLMIFLCVCTVLEFYWLGQHTFSHFLLQDVLFSRGSTGV